MLNKKLTQQVDYILAGNDLLPPIVKVKYDPNDIMLSDPARIAKRLRQYILAQTVRLDMSHNFCGIFRFDGSVEADVFTRIGHKHFSTACGLYYRKYQENLATMEWQHSTANFAKIIDCGLVQYIDEIDKSLICYEGDREKAEFLKAMRTTCETMIMWAHKCAEACEAEAEKSDEARKKQLHEMADVLRHVPEYPARSFREGVQVVYMCYTYLPDSVGLLDRYLWRLYKQDIENGRLTRELAKEYVAELFIRLCAHTKITFGDAQSYFTAESHFAIGGTLPDGSDGYNELSDIIVDTMMELPIPRPQTSLRMTNKTPFEVFKKLLDCARRDKYMRFAFVADESRLKGLMSVAGIAWDDAINYTMVGCNEPALRGSIWFGGCTTNIARSLTNLLYYRTDDICSCTDFESLFAIYEEELEADITQILKYINGFHSIRQRDCNILSSIFIDGCIESAASVTASGGRLSITGSNMMGITCVIDSLSIIKQLVYEEKSISMRELVDIMKSDWAGDRGEELRAYILKKGRFFGNNDELSDGIARRFTDALWRHIKDKRDKFGNHLLIGTLAGYNPHFAEFGKTTEATPDGRHKGDAFMVGVGQTAGKDRNGLAALLKSVAQMDEHYILTGPFLCNAYLDENLIMKNENFEKTARVIYDYFKNGGLHIQLNYVSKEELLAARENPAEHASLRVRVSGYSGNFTQLRESIQDDVIRRTVVNGR
ncbi:MAG: hypothetical protein HFE63_01320 [Clostridiales bacterium]|nr:hypothetical protein [Clostridiales bacterium]